MGECIISRGSSGSAGGSSGGGELKTEIFTQNGIFVVPKAANQSFSVRIFGGGGGGGIGTYTTFQNIGGGGGGGGWMNNAILTLNQGEAISVIIGSGGNGAVSKENVTSGGTTAFGTYLSAPGGEQGRETMAGSGGSGGGGAGSYGGRGYQFGGGGGNNSWGYRSSGGYWGGGGGSFANNSVINGTNSYRVAAGGVIYNEQNPSQINEYSGLGGSGGGNKINATDGTNTLGDESVEISLRGPGKAGTNENGYGYLCGGGGYGGCGGTFYGGGGGYGANGGHGTTNVGGGGGGYGAGHGGNGKLLFTMNYGSVGGGGGGAYGPGGDGGCDGVYGGGGGGGATCRNTVTTSSSTDIKASGNGGDGICIIQYYI